MFLQYLLLLPAFLNIFPIYSFCNMHDISWGTKEGNLQSETRRMHEDSAAAAVKKAERARAALERLQQESDEASARAKYGIVDMPVIDTAQSGGAEGGGSVSMGRGNVGGGGGGSSEEIINMGPPLPEGAFMMSQQMPDGQTINVPVRQVAVPVADPSGSGNVIMQVRAGSGAWQLAEVLLLALTVPSSSCARAPCADHAAAGDAPGDG